MQYAGETESRSSGVIPSGYSSRTALVRVRYTAMPLASHSVRISSANLFWRCTDLDLDNGVLRVRQTVGTLHGKIAFKKPKTLKSRRDIDLSAGVIAALKEHKRKQNARRLQLGATWQEYDLVFANANGGPICPDNLDRDFDRLMKKVGVKRIRIHDTRHTYATLALANGENAKTVSETLGYSDVALTLRVYGHVQPEQRKALAQRMESLLLSDPDDLEKLG